MKKPITIIAEAGVNHNGSLEKAYELVDIAADSGADFVKFQTFCADTITVTNQPVAAYQNINAGVSDQYQLLKQLELSNHDFVALAKYCQSKSIGFLSTAFDIESLDFLCDVIQIPFIKIPSGEITNAQLLYKASQQQKPILLSTGMATLADIEFALSVLAYGYCQGNANEAGLNAFKQAYISENGQKALAKNVTLLQCVSEYPTAPEKANLNAIKTLSDAFKLNVGYSDHSLGITLPIAATALGICVLEKHFTADTQQAGPDHAASLAPSELKDMVNQVRIVEKSLGHGHKLPTSIELDTADVVRKRIVARREIARFEEYSTDNITVKRATGGISAKSYWELLGETAHKSYQKDECIG